MSRLYPDYNFSESRVIFGRKSTCNVQIKHPAVSGLHCIIEQKENGVVFITDLSTNGTYVNGNLLGRNNSILLKDSSEIFLIRSHNEKIGYKIMFTRQAPKVSDRTNSLHSYICNSDSAASLRNLTLSHSN